MRENKDHIANTVDMNIFFIMIAIYTEHIQEEREKPSILWRKKIIIMKDFWFRLKKIIRYSMK